MEPLEADSLPIPKGPYVPVLVLALRAAAPASRGVGRQHDDLVPGIDDFAHLEADNLECLVHRAQGVLIFRKSPSRTWLDSAGRIHVLDVGMQ
jgi:hypothetical protein